MHQHGATTSTAVARDYENSTCIYSYYYRDHVKAHASATAISSAATRATPRTTRTGALPARLHLTLHHLAQPSRSMQRTRLRHQLARHIHIWTDARIPVNGRPGGLEIESIYVNTSYFFSKLSSTNPSWLIDIGCWHVLVHMLLYIV